VTLSTPDAAGAGDATFARMLSWAVSGVNGEAQEVGATMFAKRNKAERTAAQAWEYLSSAMASAGDTARDAGRHTVDATSAKASHLADRASRKSSRFAAQASKRSAKLADKASSRVNAAADEAWARANAAANALAGRRPGLPWGLIVGVGLLGAALGWAAANAARAALERQAEAEELELAETAVVVTPTYDK
jgi:hypothetical protein